MSIETLLKKIVATVLETRIHIDAEYTERRNAIADAAAELNDDLLPTVDCVGRLHAPVDGYMVEDNTYGKGEFIPMPDLDYGELLPLAAPLPEKQPNKKVIRVSGDLVEHLKKAPVKGEGFAMEIGKTWLQSGQLTANVYITAYFKRVCTAVSKEIEEYHTELTAKAKAEAQALKGDALEGKHTVTALVLSTPSYASSFGYGKVDHKLVIELPNKSTAYGTLPKSLYEVEAGDTVTLTATFKVTEDDKTHAYYSRPSKATITKAAK